MTEFHSRDGFYFKRLSDGTVSIRVTAMGFEHGVHLPPNEWASVIAAVSAPGETAQTYRAAENFHAGLSAKVLADAATDQVRRTG